MRATKRAIELELKRSRLGGGDVTALARERNRPISRNRPIQASWDEDLTSTKIEMAYRLLPGIMDASKGNRGGNAFKVPHSGLREAMLREGWE